MPGGGGAFDQWALCLTYVIYSYSFKSITAKKEQSTEDSRMTVTILDKYFSTSTAAFKMTL